MTEQPEMLTRAATVSGSLNIDNRTIQVVFASEQPVRRHSWDIGRYDEVLLCGRENVDLSRAGNMSLLDSHGQYNLDSRLGTVVPGSIKFERGQVVATVKLSRRTKAQELLDDLQDGMSLPISVGYRITVEERDETGEIPIVRATKWQPTEISIVSVAADPTAKTRSEENPDMPNQNNDTAEQRQPRTDTVRERTRIKDLRFIASSANMSNDELERAIDDGTSIDVFRTRAFEALVEHQAKTPTLPHVETLGVNGHSNIRSAMTDALMLRLDNQHRPKDDAREFVGLSLPELARRSLEASGTSSRGMSAGEVVQRALHTSSDFSHVITDTGQTILAKAYAQVPSAIKLIARKTTAKDFRIKTTARLSGFADLEKVNEHGEYKRGSFSEGSEGYRISTFGKVFGMTRQMIVNDDLGAFADVSRELGLSAARLESDILANLVNSNPVMSDNRTVFHVGHNNLGTGIALGEASLSAARLAMSKQTGLSGELIDVIPAYLVVSPELQTTAEKLLAAIQPTNSGDVNPFAGKLQLAVDRRLTATPWYLVANPNLVPSLEYAYLEGAEGPQFFTREGFDVDGVEIKVRVDFGAGWTDHRGWYKNPGQ